MFSEGSKILFMGDSITDANRSRDKEAAMGHGYPVMIAGELLFNEPEKQYTFVNKGISGNRVVDLLARWKADCLNLKPDVLSVLIGVNDVWHEFNRQNGVEAEKFERVYDLILEETKAKRQGIKIILCEPFILKSTATEENYPEWVREVTLRREAVKKLADKYGCIFVPLQQPFESACERAAAAYWLPDGVHPSPAGHMLIAREWIKAVRGQL